MLKMIPAVNRLYNENIELRVRNEKLERQLRTAREATVQAVCRRADMRRQKEEAVGELREMVEQLKKQLALANFQLEIERASEEGFKKELRVGRSSNSANQTMMSETDANSKRPASSTKRASSGESSDQQALSVTGTRPPRATKTSAKKRLRVAI